MKKQAILFMIFTILCLILVMLTSASITAVALNKTICIDPGHGGFDPGASVENVLEKDITLEAALYLGGLLEATGYNVIYTRTVDDSLAGNKAKDIHKRSEIINAKKNILFISLHANTFPSPICHGAQVFYNDKYNSKDLAMIIQNRLCLFDETNKRKEKVIAGKYITDKATLSGCIVELGFLTNKEDFEMLTNKEKLEKMVFQIYIGILSYLEKYE